MNDKPEPTTGDADLQDNTTEDTDYSTGASSVWLLLGLFWIIVLSCVCYVVAVGVLR